MSIGIRMSITLDWVLGRDQRLANLGAETPGSSSEPQPSGPRLAHRCAVTRCMVTGGFADWVSLAKVVGIKRGLQAGHSAPGVNSCVWFGSVCQCCMSGDTPLSGV
uniref:Uncharacterized protein n=1 Tax=Eutreptiella gymnastica TaxID=73025 RepID=A0A7S1HRR0_9EUGL|mmetsp:Transcript_100025/g.172599  ORF Transcript_100025/g.172599 Transcript_100025/m.172599 type:complete len:106 (+) Transcript_100025:322-639(+)